MPVILIVRVSQSMHNVSLWYMTFCVSACSGAEKENWILLSRLVGLGCLAWLTSAADTCFRRRPLGMRAKCQQAASLRTAAAATMTPTLPPHPLTTPTRQLSSSQTLVGDCYTDRNGLKLQYKFCTGWLLFMILLVWKCICVYKCMCHEGLSWLFLPVSSHILP